MNLLISWGCNMNCPYCNKKLISGFIYGGGYGVRKGIIWLPENIEPTLEAWVFESEKLNKNNFLSEAKVKSYKCSNCRKIIIDLDDES